MTLGLAPLILAGLMAVSVAARAEMIPGNLIGNDPTKEQICMSRAGKKATDPTPSFEIDSAYVARARSSHPDVTFVVVHGQLVDCYLREGTGRYEPASYSPEQSYWHFVRPRQFEPGIHTPQGIAMAANTCLDAAPPRINRPNFDHSVYLTVQEVGKERLMPSRNKNKAEPYDIEVNGTAFYRSSGLDLKAVKFTCLLTPMLEIKDIQLN